MPPDRGWRRWLGACLLATALAGPSAKAGPAAIHLVYMRGAGAERCPSQEELQQGVVARLGRDPFWGRGARAVWITISRSGSELVATIAAQPVDGGAAQVRAVTSRHTDCADLAAAVELALAIAIDPAAAIGRPPPQPVDTAEPVEPPGPPAPLLPAVAPPAAAISTSPGAASPGPAAARDRRWFAAGGLLLSDWAEPGPSAGLALAVGARRRSWSLALEGRLDYPTEQSVGAGAVAATPMFAAAVPCYHLRRWAACAVAAAGGLRGSARGLPGAHVDVTAYLAAGARLAAELPVGGGFGLGAHVDVLATLTPTHLRVDEREVWHTHPLSGALGFSAIRHF